MITIQRVKTRAQWKTFAAMPLLLYRNSPYYVPAFRTDDADMADPTKNFAAQGCDVEAYLAYHDGKLVGRVAGIIVHESNRLRNEKAVRFSRLDFVEDIEVASALLDAVADFGRRNGMDKVHGPWGFNDTDREGMLTYGFDEVGSYATNYNYAYYPAFMQELGFEAESAWIEQRIEFPKPGEPLYEKLIKVSGFIKRKFKMRELTDTLSINQIVKLYGDKFFDCYNAAYAQLDMFVAIKDEAKDAVLKQFTSIINPKFFSVVADENDDIAAFCIVLPSIAPALQRHKGRGNLFALLDVLHCIKHPTTLELTLMAVHPKYAKTGVNAACFGKIVKNIAESRINNVVSDPTLDTNTAVRAQWNEMKNEIIKRRQTYQKQI